MHNLLALDQASKITGYAIFQEGKLIKHGKIVTEQEDIGQRLMTLRQAVENLIAENEINEVVIEDIQLQNNVGNNVQTFKVLAEVFGVLNELFAELKMPYSAVLASSWKSTLQIKGRTRPEQKKNAQAFVQSAFGINVIQDIADAVCIGCHRLLKGTPSEDDGSALFDWS